MSTRLGRIGYLLAGGAVVWMGLTGTAPAIASGEDPSPAPAPEASAQVSPTPSEEATSDPSPSDAPSDPAPPTDPPAGDAPAPGGTGDDPRSNSGGSDHDRVRRAQQAGVDAVDDSFSPSQITVQAGSEVTWSTEGQNPHTVTADDGSFGSGTLQPGETFSTSFDAAGSFAYYCEFHGGPGGTGMSGVVLVQGADGGDGPPPATDGTTDLPPTGRDLTSAVVGGIVLAIAGLGSLLVGRRVARRPGEA